MGIMIVWRFFLMCFWRLRYAVYSRDLHPGLRAGRGSKERPLMLSDLEPVMRALRRMSLRGNRPLTQDERKDIVRRNVEAQHDKYAERAAQLVDHP